MKKEMKGFIIGFAAAVFLSTTVLIGAAATGTTNLAASYNNILLKVDGSIVTPKDANGNTVEPFIVNGTTYLPVRAVASALGMGVSWDKENNTVLINSDGTKPQETQTNTSNVTLGMKNALGKAKSYLSFMAFSRSGLIKQLEYEGFTEEEATYGADNCGANWNEQAVKKAESYLKSMSFSRDRLIAQLEYEGFTKEQAEYGVSGAGY